MYDTFATPQLSYLSVFVPWTLSLFHRCSHGYPFATHASAMLCSSSAGRVLFLQSSYGLGWVSMSHGVGLVSMSLSFLCRKGACLPNMYITLTITQDLI